MTLKRSLTLIWLLTCCLVLTGVVSCRNQEIPATGSDPDQFVLTAEIKGLNADYLVYKETNDAYPEGIRRDTIRVKNGRFAFSDKIKKHKYYRLLVPQTLKYLEPDNPRSSYLPSPVTWIEFIGYPGGRTNLKGRITDFAEVYATGEDVSGELSILKRETYPLLNTIVNIKQDFYKRKGSAREYGAVRDTTMKLFEMVKEKRRHFIRDHNNSPAAALVLLNAFERREFSTEEEKMLFEVLDSVALAKVSFYQELSQRLEALEGAVVGHEAPDIALPETNSERAFALNDLRGNYVLIHFWGTWCGPCVAEMPKIKAYADEFADRNFKVVGVDSGDGKDIWQQFISENNYNWTHLRSVKGENDLLIPYNVTALPKKFLISPEGVILAVSEGGSEAIFKKIDEIFSREHQADSH